MKAQLKLRVSGYNDYVAVYQTIDKEDKDILYISEGKVLQLHCPIRGNEVNYTQYNYEDFYDVFLLKMQKGKLYLLWAEKNTYGVYVAGFYGNSTWSEIQPDELLDFGYTKVFPNNRDAKAYDRMDNQHLKLKQ